MFVEWKGGNNEPLKITLDIDGRLNLLKMVQTDTRINLFDISFPLNYNNEFRSFELSNFPNEKRVTHYSSTYFLSDGQSHSKTWKKVINPILSQNVKQFPKLVLYYLKSSPQQKIQNILDQMPMNSSNPINKCAVETSVFILTSERLRSEKALILSFILFNRLKYK